MAFYTALSGLNGAQTELATIASNIANVGTNGFKRSRVQFGDIIANSPLQNPNRIVGSGTTVRRIAQQFQQGPTETTSSALDLAVSGQGFFVLKDARGGPATSFTRNGAFAVDAERFVVDSQGRRLQLFPTAADGSLAAADLGSTIAARLPLSSGAPQPTSLIGLTVNLPASADVVATRPAFTPANPYAFDRNDPGTYNVATATTVYDSLGNPLGATIYYVKDSAPTPTDLTHRWTARVFVGDTELSVGGTPGIPLAFDTAGVLTAPTTPFAFDGFTPPRGGAPLAITVDHGLGTTQQGGPFNVARINQDGFAAGQLESVSVDPLGALTVSFSNGEVRTLGKVALATFANPQGLKQLGDASHATSPESGPPLVGEPGSGGLGSIMSGTLERSNVDLTVELVGLITAQRNFQASAKAIETDSGLLQTIINIRG